MTTLTYRSSSYFFMGTGLTSRLILYLRAEDMSGIINLAIGFSLNNYAGQNVSIL